MQGLKSHSNRGLIRTNKKGNYGGLLGYLERWFHPNGLGNILSFSDIESLFVVTYDHKGNTFVVQTCRCTDHVKK